MKPALILSGGGARGAYQVGVLKAIADLHAKDARNPFSIISGTSAGAVNAVILADGLHDPDREIESLPGAGRHVRGHRH